MNDTSNNSATRTEKANEKRPNKWVVLEAFGPEAVIELREEQQPRIAPQFSNRTEHDQVYTYLLARWAASELADDPTERWVDEKTLAESCSSTNLGWIERDEWIQYRGSQVAVRENAINEVAHHLVNTYGEWLDDTLGR